MSDPVAEAGGMTIHQRHTSVMDGRAQPQQEPASGGNANLDLLAEDVANEIADLESQGVLRPGVEALRGVWVKHFMTVGHRRLGRALLGRHG